MRNLRKAALAGATAVAVAFGTTAVATAQETTPISANSENAPEMPTKGEDSSAAKIGGRLQADQTAYGPGIFGSSKGEAPGEKESFSQQPVWAQILYGLTIAASALAALGLIVAPAYNFLVHGR